MAQMYFLIGNVVMTIYRARCGYLTHTVLEGWCYGLIAVLIGTYIGSVVFSYISINILRKVIYTYMAVSGAIALL